MSEIVHLRSWSPPFRCDKGLNINKHARSVNVSELFHLLSWHPHVCIYTQFQSVRAAICLSSNSLSCQPNKDQSTNTRAYTRIHTHTCLCASARNLMCFCSRISLLPCGILYIVQYVCAASVYLLLYYLRSLD